MKSRFSRSMPPQAEAKFSPRAGLSLLEVLVASALMLAVMGGLYTLMIEGVEAEKVQRTVAEAQQNARLVLQLLSRHTASAGGGGLVTGNLPNDSAMSKLLCVQAPFELWQIGYVQTAAGNAGLGQADLLFGVLRREESAVPTMFYAGSKAMTINATKSDIPVPRPSGLVDADVSSTAILVVNQRLAQAYENLGGTAQDTFNEIWDNALLFTNFDARDPKTAADDYEILTVLGVVTPSVGACDGTDTTGWCAADGTNGNLMAACGVTHVVFARQGEEFYMAEFTPEVGVGGASQMTGAFRAFGTGVQRLDVSFTFYDEATSTESSMTLAQVAADQEGWRDDKPNLRRMDFDLLVKTRKKLKATGVEGGSDFASASYVNWEGDYAERLVRLNTAVHLLGYRMINRPQT
jgi:hypothetical protein